MTPEQLTGKQTDFLIEQMVGQKAFLFHPSVAQDFSALHNAATQAGFQLEIASGVRNFERQLAIWNGKFSGSLPILDSDSKPLDKSSLSPTEKLLSILRWSALPGASRHHWGTDFDLYARNLLPEGVNLQLEPWEYLEGHQAAFYQWLKEHASSFGFFFPYQQDLGGVAAEPWHISHIDAAQACLSELTLDTLSHQLMQSNIEGLGEVLEHLPEIYSRYVCNITQPEAL